MTASLPARRGQWLHELAGDVFVRLSTGLWCLLALPLLAPLLSERQLRAHSGFWVDLVLVGLAIVALRAGFRQIGSVTERTFWNLVSAALVALWLAGFGFWSPRGQVVQFVVTDFLYLTFYMALVLAALSAPHRSSRVALRQSWPGVVAVVIALLGLITYFVLIPGLLDPTRYWTWMPSMYLFQTLDLILVALFTHLFRNARERRWRAIYGFLLGATLLWTIVDVLEGLGWAGVFVLPSPGPFDLLWTLPPLAVVGAARARRLAPGNDELFQYSESTESSDPSISNVALVGTVAFPMLHFAFSLGGLLHPDLNSAREVVVGASVVALGTIAFVERLGTARQRKREARAREGAERALRESEARYRTLVEHAPEAIVIFDADTGRFVDSNERALDLYEVSRERLLEVGPADLSPPRQPDGTESSIAARSLVERVLEGEVLNFEWVHQTPSGRPVHCNVFLVALPSSGRRLVRGSLIDITDELALRDQLRESRRLESIGRLAGGVAHDFNNLLTVISGYSDIALQDPEAPPQMQKRLLEIQKAGDRAASLTRQLLAFGRRQAMSMQAVDLNQVVLDMEELLRRLLGEDVLLQLSLAAGLEPIQADPAQVEQVIVNLAANGRDSMPDGGRLYIETSQVQLTKPKSYESTVIPPGGYGCLTVRDEGVGMDAATRGRVFEPFFTTKEVGEGTGLGLATVYGIVTQSEGHLAVTSAPGKGSSFAVHFPLATAKTRTPEDIKRPDRVPKGRERILFVEDDESVRSLQCTGLQALGYRVLAARNGEHALSLVEHDNSDIDVLVTDVVLPSMSGPQLAERVIAIRPGIEVIFVSGYTDDLIRRKGTRVENAPLLNKPFSPIDLARTIRGLLGTR